MMLCPPKLAQIRPNLKLPRPSKCKAFKAVWLQIPVFWSFSLVPNCPNWPPLFHQRLYSFVVFRKKNPSPRSMDVHVCKAILPITKLEAI